MAASIGLLFVIGGAISMLIGSIGIIVAAFSVSALWGLGCLLIPGANVVFAATHWDECKRSLGYFGGGVVALLLGVVVAGAAAPDPGAKPGAPATQTASAPPVAEAPRPRIVPQVIPPTPTVVPLAAPAAAPAGAGSKAADAIVMTGGTCLRVYFRNPFDTGRVIVRAGGVELLKKDLQNTTGLPTEAIDEVLTVSPGAKDLQVWVMAEDRSVNFYRTYPNPFTPQKAHALDLEIQPAGLAVALH